MVMSRVLRERVQAAAEAESIRTGEGVSASRWIRGAIEMRLAGEDVRPVVKEKRAPAPVTKADLESREAKFQRALAEARKKRGEA